MGSVRGVRPVAGRDFDDRDANIFNLRCLLEKEPDNAGAQFRLGCLLSDSDGEEALLSLRKALKLTLKDDRQAELRRETTRHLIQVMRGLQK